MSHSTTWNSLLSSHRISSRLVFCIAVALLLLVCCTEQVAVPMALRIGGMAPDLALFVAIAVGLLRGSDAGALVGMGGAYLLTAIIPFSPGSFYFSHLLTGYAAGATRRMLHADSLAAAALVGCLGGLLSEALFFLLSPRDLVTLAMAAFAQAVYGAVGVPIAFLLLRRLSRAIDDEDNIA